jgi:phosphonate metabolism protein PhnN/1,5-bisphosphokinase (PRPP-forming)
LSKNLDNPALLVLVVGPSGAGKDTLLDAARVQLAGDDRFVFVQRHITRAAGAGGERHQEVSWDEFYANVAAGRYALSWQAHGLGYGIPMESLQARTQGRRVIANVSRAIVSEARRLLAPVRVVVVTARPETLALRLAMRGRETAVDAAARAARAESAQIDGPDVVVIDNDGALPDAVAQFMAALRA